MKHKLLLALCILFISLLNSLVGAAQNKPLAVFPDEGEHLMVMGQFITQSTSVQSPWLKSGSINYDAQNKVLTLNNVTIEQKDRTPLVQSSIADLHIKLVGTSVVHSKHGIVCTNSTLITGDELYLVTQGQGLTAGPNSATYNTTLTIRGCKLLVKGREGITGTYSGGNVIFDKATVRTISENDDTGALRAFNQIDFKDCNITTPSPWKLYKWPGWYIRNDQKVVAQDISISPDHVTPVPQPGQPVLQVPSPISPYITMTTTRTVGEEIALYVEASGNFDVEGATFLRTEQKGAKAYRIYRLNRPNIIVNGDITVLDCSNNALKNIDPSDSPNLRELNCSHNLIDKDFEVGISFNISSNLKLKVLNCAHNYLSYINREHNKLLEVLDVSHNQLNRLDFYSDDPIKKINCSHNAITEFPYMDLAKSLEQLQCDNNKLQLLNFSYNTQLRELVCNDNQIYELNFSETPKMTKVVCHGNRIFAHAMKFLVHTLPATGGTLSAVKSDEDGNVMYRDYVQTARSKGWKVTDAQGTSYDGTAQDNTAKQITLSTTTPIGQPIELQISANGAFNIEGAKFERHIKYEDEEFDVYRIFTNHLTLKGDITGLDTRDARIADIDVTRAPNLQQLSVMKSRLTSIDLTQNPKLIYLNCASNQLKSLDVSHCPLLGALICSNNALKALNLSANPRLSMLICSGNGIQGSSMRQLVNSLPQVQNGLFIAYDTQIAFEGNIITHSQVKIAKDKGWKVLDLQNNDYAGVADELPEKKITLTTTKNVGELITLELESHGDIKVEGATLRSKAYKAGKIISTYRLTSQQVVLKGNISMLTANNNQITAITLDNADALWYLSANDNQLSSIDVANCPKLTHLNLKNNRLTTLDLSQNPALRYVIVPNNQLTSLSLDEQAEQLGYLEIWANRINASEMDELIDALPTRPSSHLLVQGSENEQNQISKEQIARAEAKGWTVEDHEGIPVGISPHSCDAEKATEVYDLSGRKLDLKHAKGVIIVRQGGRTTKRVAR